MKTMANNKKLYCIKLCCEKDSRRCANLIYYFKLFHGSTHVRNKATTSINGLQGFLYNVHVIIFCDVCIKQNLKIVRLLLHLAYLKLRLKEKLNQLYIFSQYPKQAARVKFSPPPKVPNLNNGIENNLSIKYMQLPFLFPRLNQ